MNYDKDIVNVQKCLSAFKKGILGDDQVKKLAPLFEGARESEHSKMLFFLTLNTRLGVMEKLKEDPTAGLLAGICPLLRVVDLVNIIIGLGLTSSFGDVICNCPGVISIELLNCFCDKFRSTCVEVKNMERILVAIFKKSTKIRLGIHSDFSFTDLLRIFHSLPKYMLDNAALHEDSVGHRLKALESLLETCLTCVKICSGETLLEKDNPIFAMDFTLFPASKFNQDGPFAGMSGFSAELDLKVFMANTFDLYSETLKNFHSLHSSPDVLSHISETAFQLIEKIEETPMKPANLDSLKSIMKKPVTESDEIENSTLEMIISRMTEQPAKNWFRALVRFPKALEDDTAVACISSNVDLADLADLNFLLDSVQDESRKTGPLPGNVSDLYLTSLKRLTVSDQISRLNVNFDEDLNMCSEPDSFDDEITERFNKITEYDGLDPDTVSAIVAFCMQSPAKTISKICHHAFSTPAQVKVCIEYLTMLRSACLSKTSYKGATLNLISAAFCDLIDNDDATLKERQHLVSLVTAVNKEKLLDERFLEIGVVKVLRKEMLNGNLQKVNFLLEVLRSIIKSKQGPLNQAVLLAFMLRVLSHTSWDCRTFSVPIADARETAVSIITWLIRNSKISDEKELAWLHREVLKSSEMTQSYFCDIWYSCDRDFVVSQEFYLQLYLLLHTKFRVHAIIDFIVNKFQFKNFFDLRAAFFCALVKLLPVLTRKEWSDLFTYSKSIFSSWWDLQSWSSASRYDIGLDVLGMFVTALFYLARCLNRTREMEPCFEYCVRNLGKVIRENSLSSEKVDPKVYMHIRRGTLFLLNGIASSEMRKSCSVILSPIFFEFENRTKDEDSSSVMVELEELLTWFKKDFV